MPVNNVTTNTNKSDYTLKPSNISRKIDKHSLNEQYTKLCQQIAYKRLRGIYCTSMASQAQIQCKLADLYMDLGLARLID